MRRLKAIVSYDGTQYHGWQVQPGLPTIQGLIEQHLAFIEGSPVHVEGSGRTDAGVHALAVCAVFNLQNPIPTPNLRKALNRLLPPDIRILEVEECAPDFHPRFHARAKTYEYRLWRAEICPPFLYRYVLHHPFALDEDAMIACAPILIGEHDFTAFCAADPDDALGHSKVRRIFSSDIRRDGDTLIYRVRGSGFLKHMVRFLTGFLLEVGKGNESPQTLLQFLSPENKQKSQPPLPARGLFQISVEYPEIPTLEDKQR
jgi:tRNA pseudouridine38-40 synthase